MALHIPLFAGIGTVRRKCGGEGAQDFQKKKKKNLGQQREGESTRHSNHQGETTSSIVSISGWTDSLVVYGKPWKSERGSSAFCPQQWRSFSGKTPS